MLRQRAPSHGFNCFHGEINPSGTQSEAIAPLRDPRSERQLLEHVEQRFLSVLPLTSDSTLKGGSAGLSGFRQYPSRNIAIPYIASCGKEGFQLLANSLRRFAMNMEFENDECLIQPSNGDTKIMNSVGIGTLRCVVRLKCEALYQSSDLLGRRQNCYGMQLYVWFHCNPIVTLLQSGSRGSACARRIRSDGGRGSLIGISKPSWPTSSSDNRKTLQ